MSTSAVQLPFLTDFGLPFDPNVLADLTTPERGRVYADCGLDDAQRMACEAAVRLVIRGQYPKGASACR
jgi:hypothetical protein